MNCGIRKTRIGIRKIMLVPIKIIAII